MPLSTINAGDEILATDINAHITQTNTNTANIATNTSNISTNTSNIASNTSSISTLNSQMTTANSNITTINHTLSGFNNVPNDSNLSSSGGVLQCNTISPTTGSITRISHFSGTGSGSVSHGLGATPDIIVCTYAGNFGTAPTQAIAWYSAGSSSVNVAAQSGYFWTGLAIKF